MKLLYVEDNPFDRDLTRRALLKQLPGLEWDTAASVEEAIGKLDSRKYDVVLLDMWLQDGCGMDVLLHVRRHNLELAVVIVTGSGDEGSVIQYLKAGAQDYVPKRGTYLEQLGGHLARARERMRDNIRPNPVLTALFVESSADDIDLTRRHFERRAPHISLAFMADATSALTWLAQPGHHVDVALLDLRLPGMTGLELLEKLQSDYRFPCIMITGRGDEAVAARAMNLGAVDYVIKDHGYVAALPCIIEYAHLLAAYSALRLTYARIQEGVSAA
ncbi:MAG: response regulator [Thiobacillus sp.]|nr:response regulator [Thiobacillus sp.]